MARSAPCKAISSSRLYAAFQAHLVQATIVHLSQLFGIILPHLLDDAVHRKAVSVNVVLHEVEGTLNPTQSKF
jgi:hypothetical protein